jgi:hypothetical protein
MEFVPTMFDFSGGNGAFPLIICHDHVSKMVAHGVCHASAGTAARPLIGVDSLSPHPVFTAGCDSRFLISTELERSDHDPLSLA